MERTGLIGRIRELHITHDPDTGEVGYVALIDYGSKLVRYRAEGQYRRVDDQPKTSLSLDTDVEEMPLGDLSRHYMGGARRASVSFEASFEVKEFVREIVNPPSEDEQP